MVQVQCLRVFFFPIKKIIWGENSYFLLLKHTRRETQKYSGIKETKKKKAREEERTGNAMKKQAKVGFFGNRGLKGRKKKISDSQADVGIKL